MKIYADILFSINFFMDIFIIYVSGVFLKYKTEFKSILFSSFVCAFVCSVFQILFFGNIAVNLLLMVSALLFLVKKTLKPANVKSLLNSCITVVFVSFFTAGIFIWIYSYSNFFYYMAEYFSLSAAVFSLCLAVSAATFFVWTKKMRQMTVEKDTYLKAKIKYESREIEINLFIDSGCTLKKSTDRSIIIAEIYEIKDLLDEKMAYELMQCNCAEEIISVAEKQNVKDDFELLKFSTASGDGEMACLKCEGMFFDGKNEVKVPITAGIFFGRLFSDNDCHGIIGLSEVKNIM